MKYKLTAEAKCIWELICKEVRQQINEEPALEEYLSSSILQYDRLEDSLAHLLSHRLALKELKVETLLGIFAEFFSVKLKNQPCPVSSDICAVYERDPAARCLSDIFLFMKGFHALEAYRLSHWLWTNERKTLARLLQHRISEIYAVDIHPGAKIGCGIFIDHATSVVIGETAVIADKVSILHEVTLGGTGKETGDRHPKLQEGVLVGAGAKILGNVTIGKCAKIASGSVVLTDVPEHSTAAGVPARIVGSTKHEQPALAMDQQIHREQIKRP